MSLPFISIVSINWNSVNDTLDLLASIYNSNYPKSKYEVIVVDNGSTDRSIQKIKAAFPKTLLISLPKNIGIPARNIGLEKSKGEILFSVDSDVVLSRDTLITVVKRLQKDSSIGLVSVKALDKKTHVSLPNPVYVNFFTGTISSLDPYKETDTATYVAGLFHAFPKKVIKKIGLYNSDFFFYGDDLDFSVRIKKAGLKVLYTKDAVVYHGKSRATPDIPHTIKYHHYYKAIFRNIYNYGNFMQKISVTFFQLILIPFYRLLIKRENTFTMRWWGFGWNIKHLEKETKIFIFVVLLGLALRLFTIDKRDFWFDEAFTHSLARLPIIDLFKAVLTDNNPPIYYLLIYFVLKLGNSEILLRLPSLIASLATTLLIYATFKTRHSNSGLIAATLFTLSPVAIYIATEARLHSLATLIIFALVALFLKIRKNPQPKAVLIFVILGILGLYTQYYVSLIFLSFTLVLMFFKSSLSIRKWAFVLTLIAIPLAPWLFFSTQTTHNGCSCPNTIVSLPASLVSPALGGVGEVTLRSLPDLPLPMLLLFAATAFVTLIFFFKGLFRNYLLSTLYGIPLVTLTIFGLFLPVFSPKAFASFAPLYFGITALGVNSFKQFKAITIILVILISFVSLIQITNTFFGGTKLTPIYNIVSQDKAFPVVHTSLLTYYSINFYSRGNQKHILITQNPLSSETVKFIGGEKQEVDTKSENLWLVDTEKWTEVKDRETALKKILDTYSVKKSYKVDKISVKLLKRK